MDYRLNLNPHALLFTFLFFLAIACKKDNDCDAATTADAGTDQTIIGTSTKLAGNTPRKGIGTWSIVSGTDGTIADPLNPTSAFSGTTGNTYVLKWSITGCPASEDEVEFIFMCDPAATANAGVDQTIVGATATLAANTPSPDTGSWSIVSGTGGIITEAANPASTFTGDVGTTYVLRWTVTCPASQDDVQIIFTCDPTATANAGPDQNIVGTTATLTANTTSQGAGSWSIVSGTGGTIAAPASPASTFTGIVGTTYLLRWTVTCPASQDDVQIIFACDPTTAANAGPDQNIVGTTATLAANASSQGLWSIVSGAGGTVTTPANPASTFTGVVGTAYVLRWTVTCPASQDDVQITFSSTNPQLLTIDKTSAINGEIITVTGLNFTANYNGGSQINILKSADPLINQEVFLSILSRTATEIKAVVIGTNGGATGDYKLRYNKKPDAGAATVYPSNLTVTIIAPTANQFYTSSTFTATNHSKGSEASFGIKNGSLTGADYSIKLIQYNYTSGVATEYDASITSVTPAAFGSMDKIAFTIPVNLPSNQYYVKITYGGKSLIGGWGSSLNVF